MTGLKIHTQEAIKITNHGKFDHSANEVSSSYEKCDLTSEEPTFNISNELMQKVTGHVFA